MSAVLEAHGLYLSFGRVHALQGVSLQVAEGEAVALVGPNGAGKSSLLRVLAGLVRPQQGSVRCGEAATPPALRRAVAYCPDHGALYPAPCGASGRTAPPSGGCRYRIRLGFAWG